MSIVDTQTVKKVAHLARLEPDAQTLENLAGQIDHILEYVQQLQEVNTDFVEPTSHPLDLTNVLRKDEALSSLDPKSITQMAPTSQGTCITVPKVIEG